MLQCMYYFLGRMLVLQPDEAQRFVYGGADHPMLPPGPNLFALREPWNLSAAADKLGRRLSNNIQPAPAISGPSRATAAAAAAAVVNTEQCVITEDPLKP